MEQLYYCFVKQSNRYYFPIVHDSKKIDTSFSTYTKKHLPRSQSLLFKVKNKNNFMEPGQ